MLRIASFNAENLMERFDFAAARKGRGGHGHAHHDDARQMKALAIAACGADVVCLQEVENRTALDDFEDAYLYPTTGVGYPHKVWTAGNDSRGIDVALMARERTATGETIEVLDTRSHRKRSYADFGLHNAALAKMGVEAHDRIFRRDCLEVDLAIGGRRLTLFLCHFKSMGPGRNGVPGREWTLPVRLAEALAVRRIVRDRFGTDRAARMRWLVVGDLNDYRERLAVTGNRVDGFSFATAREATSGIEPLFEPDFGEDLMQRRAADDRWTLHYEAGPVEDIRKPGGRAFRHLVQLDYLIASPALAKGNADAVPDIVRAGLPHRVVMPAAQAEPRYPRTGWDRPKASDHCPVAVTLQMV